MRRDADACRQPAARMIMPPADALFAVTQLAMRAAAMRRGCLPLRQRCDDAARAPRCHKAMQASYAIYALIAMLPAPAPLFDAAAP